MTRAEHLAWAKRRALEYVDEGQLSIAITSMMSDLLKHPELMDFRAIGEAPEDMRPASVRKWIEGFK